MKVTVDVSEANEGADAPWWIIIDPRQMMSADVHEVAGMITGPFFSRQEAEALLRKRAYSFSDKTQIFCMSGFSAAQYRDAWRNADDELMKARRG